MFKIVITGPESTGKSTLTNQLAAYFKVEMVSEYARTYLQKLNKEYSKNDLTEIAKGQIVLEDKAQESDSRFIICDTSLEVIKIWSEFKYKSCDSFISKSLQQRQPSLYLLMTPDLPWEADPLRENPEDRDVLFDLYQKELNSSNVPFYEIYGNGAERFKMAKRIIEKIVDQ